MDGALKVLLPLSLILLASAETSDTKRFPPELQKHIDKALKNVRDTYIDHHVAFYSLNGTPRVLDKTLHVNVLLSVKQCERSRRNTDKCVPQKKILYLIDCLLCKTKDDQELLDCGKWVDVKNKKRDERNKCTDILLGGKTLFQTSDDFQNVRCPGCM